MNSQHPVLGRLKSQKILPLFSHPDSAVCLQVVDALYTGGSGLIEFTNRGTWALKNFKAILENRKAWPALLFGAGTITSATAAAEYIEAGADFLVSPFFDAAIADIAYLNKVLYIPGCLSPTEINRAADAGCVLIKLFPASAVGINYLKSISPIFPQIEFLVTGGILDSDMHHWLQAGAMAVGMGSLVPSHLLDQGDFSAISTLLKQALSNLTAQGG